jgi:hypothetical protein
MSQRHFFVLVVLIVAVTAVPWVDAQSTYTDTVTKGVDKHYRVTPASSGQLMATLSWDNRAANLLFVLVCGTDSPITYGVGAGQLDRTARLESGILGLNPCVIGVSTVDTTAAYRLNLQLSTDQLATVLVPTLEGVAPASERPLDARLVEQAERTLTELKARMR